jgi:cytochrome P450
VDLPEDVLDARRNFLEYDPPEHGRYRRLISTNFTPGAVAVYEVWLRKLISEKLDGIESGEEFDFVERLAAPVPIRVLAHMLGLPDEDLPRLISLGDRLLVDTDPEYVGDFAFAEERAEDRYKPFGSPWADELCALGRAYYANRRECPRDDVLTLLANAEIDGRRLSERELDNTFALLIVAGNETTRQGLALGTLAMAKHPDQYDLVRARPELIRSAVEEMLRYSSPVWWFRRTAAKDVTVRGQNIAAGDKVVIWFAAANRDPDHYEAPHRFDVTRNPTDQLTFGRGGPHHCLGVHLARLETKVYLEELITRVAKIEVTGTPVRHRSNFTNGLKRLPVRMTLG